jgi:uncharacterized membrane protein
MNYFIHKDKQLRENRWIFLIVLITATLGLLAAFILSIDAIELIKNPNVQLTCSINSIINCATVAKTSYASMFGFPNSFLGMMAEPAFIVIAIAGLFGIRFPRRFMFGVQIMATFSLLFAYYLFFIGTFVIQAVCPWCFLVDIVTTVMFFAITRYNIREGNLYLSKKLAERSKAFIKKDYDKLAIAILIVVIVAIMILKFGNGLFA